MFLFCIVYKIHVDGKQFSCSVRLNEVWLSESKDSVVVSHHVISIPTISPELSTSSVN